MVTALSWMIENDMYLWLKRLAVTPTDQRHSQRAGAQARILCSAPIELWILFWLEVRIRSWASIYLCTYESTLLPFWLWRKRVADTPTDERHSRHATLLPFWLWRKRMADTPTDERHFQHASAQARGPCTAPIEYWIMCRLEVGIRSWVSIYLCTYESTKSCMSCCLWGFLVPSHPCLVVCEVFALESGDPYYHDPYLHNEQTNAYNHNCKHILAVHNSYFRTSMQYHSTIFLHWLILCHYALQCCEKTQKKTTYAEGENEPA
jgi:hypothetical protein